MRKGLSTGLIVVGGAVLGGMLLMYAANRRRSGIAVCKARLSGYLFLRVCVCVCVCVWHWCHKREEPSCVS